MYVLYLKNFKLLRSVVLFFTSDSLVCNNMCHLIFFLPNYVGTFFAHFLANGHHRRNLTLFAIFLRHKSGGDDGGGFWTQSSPHRCLHHYVVCKYILFSQEYADIRNSFQFFINVVQTKCTDFLRKCSKLKTRS